jgi:hypothetical protein
VGNLYAEVESVNETKGYRFGSSGVFETSAETVGELYRDMRREYGRCTGKVYIDTADGRAKAIGWVFVKREKYEDTGEPFLMSTWAMVHDVPPDVTRRVHYHELTDAR